jgi:hypothetical protein
MKSYLLKASDREEGPYQETEVAQMFADGRVDRNTRCKRLENHRRLSADAEIRNAIATAHRESWRSSDTAAGRLVATDLSRGFRHSVLVRSENDVQMDGSSFHRGLLLLANHFCALANRDDSLCRAN